MQIQCARQRRQVLAPAPDICEGQGILTAQRFPMTQLGGSGWLRRSTYADTVTGFSI